MNFSAIDHLGIERLATDSRRVERGATFVAYPGETQDGRSYIAQAIARGAGSVLWEKRGFRWLGGFTSDGSTYELTVRARA